MDPEPPLPTPEARAEFVGVRREQALLRAESTVRLWHALEAELEPEGTGP